MSSPPTAPATVDLRERATAALRRLVGRDDVDFRDGQLEAISALVEGRRRVLVVQRTGWGKSAVYFVATALRRAEGAGPTVIVSPLLALMRDQIAAAERAGIRAVTLNSTNADEWGAVSGALARGEVDVLLVSPERLNNPRFRDEQLPALAESCGLLVVDEAHCISDWGHDFRPDYRRIRDLLTTLPDRHAGARDDRHRQRPRRHRRRRAARRRRTRRAHPAGAAGPSVPAARRAAARRPGAASRLAHRPPRRAAGLGHRLRPHRGCCRGRRRGPARGGARRRRLHGSHRDRRSGCGSRGPCATTRSRRSSPRRHLAWASTSPTSASCSTSARRARRWPTTSRSVAPGAPPSVRTCSSCPGPRTRTSGATSPRRRCPVRTRPTRCCEPSPRRHEPLSTVALESIVDVRRTRLELLLKVLDVDGAVQRVPGRLDGDRGAVDLRRRALRPGQRGPGRASSSSWSTTRRTDECRMAFLQECLDDDTAQPCGRCDRCVGAVVRHRRSPRPRSTRHGRRLERPGVVLDHAGPVAHGHGPSRGAGQGQDRPGRRDGARAAPWPACPTSAGGSGCASCSAAPTARCPRRSCGPASTCSRVGAGSSDPWRSSRSPSRRRPQLVRSLAAGLGELGRLPYLGALDLVEGGPVGDPGGNSAFRLANVWGRLAVGPDLATALHGIPGPVLLVDDVADSRWTLTVCAGLLREAGAPGVLPLVLAQEA